MPQTHSSAGDGGEDAKWRTFVHASLITTTISLLLLGSANFIVNPAGFYPTRLLPRLTESDALEKHSLLERAAPKPELIILGSSKAMKLSPKLAYELTGLVTFNASTGAAVPADMLQSVRHALNDLSITPRVVLIGVDVEMFHNGDRPTSHLPSLSARAQALLSPEQTQQSIRSVRIWGSGVMPQKLRVIEPDGYLREPRVEADVLRGVNTFDRDLPHLVSTYATMWRTYSAVSQEELNNLRELIELCRSKQIQVHIFLTPTHPRLEAALNPYRYPERKAEVQAALSKISSAAGVRFTDLSNIETFQGDLQDFYDGAHVSEPNAARMLRTLTSSHAVQ